MKICSFIAQALHEFVKIALLSILGIDSLSLPHLSALSITILLFCVGFKDKY